VGVSRIWNECRNSTHGMDTQRTGCLEVVSCKHACSGWQVSARADYAPELHIRWGKYLIDQRWWGRPMMLLVVNTTLSCLRNVECTRWRFCVHQGELLKQYWKIVMAFYVNVTHSHYLNRETEDFNQQAREAEIGPPELLLPGYMFHVRVFMPS